MACTTGEADWSAHTPPFPAVVTAPAGGVLPVGYQDQ